MEDQPSHDACEWDWPKPLFTNENSEKLTLSGKLKLLESSLVCQICKEYLQGVPTMLPCGCSHLYCSECLDKNWDKGLNPQARQECYTCGKKCEQNKWIPQAGMSKIVSQFQSCRVELLQLLAGNPESARFGNGNGNGNGNGSGNRNGSGNGKKIEIRMCSMKLRDMKLGALQTLLKKASSGSTRKLRTDGPKDALEKRYREFLRVHNEQLGNVFRPLTLDEVINQVTKRENARDLADRERKKLATNLVNSKEFQGGYHKLIEQVRLPRSDAKGYPEEKDNKGAAADWRIVFSENMQRPFFFNATREMGQWEVPTELLGEDRDLQNVTGKRFEGEGESGEEEEEDVSGNPGVGKRSPEMRPGEAAGMENPTPQQQLLQRKRARENNPDGEIQAILSPNPGDSSGRQPYNHHPTTAASQQPHRQRHKHAHPDSSTFSSSSSSSSSSFSSAMVLPENQSSSNPDRTTPVSQQVEAWWSCPRCTLHNSSEILACVVCGATNPTRRLSQRTGVRDVREWVGGGISRKKK